MSVFERRNNGTLERHEPRREEDILTLETVALRIAELVAKENATVMKQGRDKIVAALTSAGDWGARQIAEASAKAIRDIGKAQAQAVQAIGNVQSQSILFSSQEVDRHLATINAMFARKCDSFNKDFVGFKKFVDDLFVKTREDTTAVIRQCQNSMANAAVSTLTGIIGKEIEKYELEKLICSAMTEAVGKTIRALQKNTEPHSSQPPTGA